ncbi:MAG: RNA polymerase sigma factor [Gemmatimonadaceae bacterium]
MTSSHIADVTERFDRLLREFGPAIARLASVYEREPNEREDLMQDIVFALWRALPAFRGECSEKTFVYRIAQNRCLTHRWRRRTHDARLVELNNLKDLPDPATGAEMMHSISRAELLTAVQRLPGLQRDVIVLSLEGLSNGEIADVLGISDSNAGVRLMRARVALRKILTRENKP